MDLLGSTVLSQSSLAVLNFSCKVALSSPQARLSVSQSVHRDGRISLSLPLSISLSCCLSLSFLFLFLLSMPSSVSYVTPHLLSHHQINFAPLSASPM